MRASICPVDAGLYIVRYVSSEPSGQPPAARVKPTDGCEHDMDIVMAPGELVGHLDAPGSNLVLVVHQPSRLEIVVDGEEAAPGPDAKFKVECLGRRKPNPNLDRLAPAEPVASAVEPSGAGLLMTAHVQRRGDVEAANGQWIGGPDDPTPIEGLSCRCPGTGLKIDLQVMNTLSGRWSSWHEAESFAGTRQKASPLTALRLRLTGPEAERFGLVAEALFLNAPTMVREGRDVILLGAGMMDPLVGLRVTLKPAQPEAPASGPRKPPRVRVFKSDGSTAPNVSQVA